jgi:predicted nucleic acid-binding Zn ribbon protein
MIGKQKHSPDTARDAATIALDALVWTLGDEPRATRLVAVTGLDPADLRRRLSDPAVLAASLAFLEAHEPDLVACATALGTTPAALVDARAALENRA